MDVPKQKLTWWERKAQKLFQSTNVTRFMIRHVQECEYVILLQTMVSRVLLYPTLFVAKKITHESEGAQMKAFGKGALSTADSYGNTRSQ